MADFLYMAVALLISLLAIFIFDIHWSFYPGETLLPPSRSVFAQDPTPYYIGVPLGGLIGFFLLKAISYAFMEEEEAHQNGRKNRNGRKRRRR